MDLCALTGIWRPLAVRYVEMLFERGMVERQVFAGKSDDWALTLSVSAHARMHELLCGFARTLAAEPQQEATA